MWLDFKLCLEEVWIDVRNWFLLLQLKYLSWKIQRKWDKYQEDRPIVIIKGEDDNT